MGIVDKAKSTADSVVSGAQKKASEAQDAVENVKEEAGEAIDEFEDEVQEQTGVNLDGKKSRDKRNKGNQKSDKGKKDESTGKDKNRIGSEKGKGTGSQDKSSSTDGKPKFPLSKQDRKKQREKAVKDFDSKEATDNDLIDLDKSNDGTVFESGLERDVQRGLNSPESDQRERATNFLKAQNQKKQQKKQLQQNRQNRQKIQSSKNAVLEVPQENGKTKKYTGKEAQEKLKERKKTIEENIDKINQFQKKVGSNINRDQGFTFSERVEKQKKQNPEIGSKGPVQYALNYGNTALSGKGGELLVASTTGKTEKTRELIRDRTAESMVRDKGGRTFSENVQQLKEVGSSPPGLLATGVAGGFGISAGIRGVASKSAAAGKVARGGAAAAGAASIGIQGKKAQEKLKEGKAVEAGGILVDTGAATTGFVKGSRIYSSKYAPKVGTTRVSQKSTLFKKGQGSSSEGFGSGRFAGKTNIQRQGFIRSLRGKQPKVEKLESSGKFKVETDSTGSEAFGKINIQKPSGSTSKNFQAKSIIRGTGETATGKKTVTTKDIIRFEQNNRLFRTTKTRESVRNNILQSQKRTKINDQPVQKIKSTSGGRNQFSDSKVTIFNEGGAGRSGSSSFGSGSGTKSISKGKTSSQEGGQGFKLDDVLKEAATGRLSELSSGRTVAGTSTGESQESESPKTSTTGSTSDLDSGNLRTANIQTGNGSGQQVDRRKQSKLKARRDQKNQNEDVFTGKSSRNTPTSNVRSTVENKVGTRSKNKNRLEQRPESRLQNSQVTTPKINSRSSTRTALSFKTAEVPKLQQRTQTRNILETRRTAIVATPQITRGGAGPIPFNLGSQDRKGSSQISGPGKGSSRRSSTRLDILSANLVEQTTGEEAVYPVSGKGNILSGKKTVQESTGKVSKPEYFSSKNLI